VGIAAVVVGLFLIVVGALNARAHRSLATTPRLTCAELAAAMQGPAIPRHAAVSGVTAPGPAGLVAAPLSGVSAVYYRVDVWRRYKLSPADDGPDIREFRVFGLDSATPFTLADAGGSVLVDPGLIAGLGDHDRPPTEVTAVEETRCDAQPGRPYGPHLETLVRRGLVPPDAVELVGTEAFRVQETVVRPHRQVIVVGAPRWEASAVTLVKPGGLMYAVTTLDWRELLAARGRTARRQLLPGILLLLAGAGAFAGYAFLG